MRCFFPLVSISLLTVIAQTSDTAILEGLITDSTKAVVRGVSITATNTLTAMERKAESGANGAFSMAGLPAGSYRIVASKPGFADAELEAITLAGGTNASIQLRLNVTRGRAEVIVTGVAGEIRTDQPQIGNLLDSAQIQSTPLLNRRITFLPLLSAANRPAISQGDIFLNQNLFTTNGAGRRQTTFEVDGSTGNDSWGRQTIFSTVPMAAVEEMKVLESGFSAEYGGSTGSAVNIVTKSGGNRFHGEILEMFRPSAAGAALSGFTSANATSGNQITSDHLDQTALSLSGPLFGRHTHFFTAVELSRQDRVSPITSPIAPGSFTGEYRGVLAFARVDHQINDNNALFFRGNLDGFRDTNPNGTVGGNSLPSVGRIFRRKTYSTELGETAVLSPSLINNLRLQFQVGSPITKFDPIVNGTQYQVPISTGGTFITGTSQSALLQNRQYQVIDTLSSIRGQHQLKLGASVIAAHNGGNSKEFGGPIYLGQFIYNTCTQALTVCESGAYLNNIANVRSYTQSYGNSSYTVNDTLWSLFLQDDYRVRRDLTINLGLRYEQQTFTDSRKNLAPRAGFAYNLNGAGRTVVRAGFGLYYSQVVNNNAANYALTGPTGIFNYTATPGQIGFPSSVAAAPLPAFPAGALVPLRSLYIRPGRASELDPLFPTSTLLGYQNQLLNPYSEQWTFGVEHRLMTNWVLRVDYVGSHTLKINRPLDVNPPSSFLRTAPNQIRTAQAANCTRPYWVWWYQQRNQICNPTGATNPQPPYSVITSDVNNGYGFYNAMNLNLTHRFSSRLSMLASYTWSHATGNVDPDVPGQNPNDPLRTGRIEHGNAIFDQRQRFVLSGFYVGPWKLRFGGVNTMATGLPFNYVTGTNNSGDIGATADRPVIGGVVVGRNIGRGRAIYDFSPFIDRGFVLKADLLHLELRAESFNVLNHANFVGYSGTYGNGATAGAGFGAPLAGINAQFPARSLQFSVKLGF